MIPLFLVQMVARTGIPARFQRIAAGIAMLLFFVLVIGLLVVAVRNHIQTGKDEAVALDRSDISAAVSNRIIEADRAASANEIERDETDTQNEKEIDRAVEKADNSTAGAGVAAVMQRVREQQAAGRR